MSGAPTTHTKVDVCDPAAILELRGVGKAFHLLRGAPVHAPGRQARDTIGLSGARHGERASFDSVDDRQRFRARFGTVSTSLRPMKHDATTISWAPSCCDGRISD